MRAHLVLLTSLTCSGLVFAQAWTTVGGNAQHTAASVTGAQSFNVATQITKVDQVQAGTTGSDILAHYGVPIITAANTVFVPVRNTTLDPNNNQMFDIEIHAGPTPTVKATLTSDYRQPQTTAWTPSYGPALSARNVLYWPGSGGTVYYMTNPDTNTSATGQIAFYGPLSMYLGDKLDYDTNVMISTPIVSDRFGDIFFGFVVQGGSTGLPSGGIARISVTGAGSFVSAASASGDASMIMVPFNSVPALSNDSSTLYFSVSNGSNGYLVSVNATTLKSPHHVELLDPSTASAATLSNSSSASPTVGPDGDVYYGVLAGPSSGGHNFRGWLLHYNSTLTATKTPGSFGWDDTPSIVAAGLVPSYHGTSTYLILTKYNNYKDGGGDGQNKMAVLDPNNQTELDPIDGTTTVMNEILTILGVTDDSPPAGAVKEWCINSAAIDKVNKVAIVNSEDGHLYRWDFTTNMFTQSIMLNGPVGEAYTPTVIGPDGTSWAINDGFLYAVTSH